MKHVCVVFVCARVCTEEWTFDDDDDDDDDTDVDDRYDYDGLALKCVARDSFNVLPQRSATITINLDPCQSNRRIHASIVLE